MIAAAWVCLFSPLAAAVLITLGGTPLVAQGAGYLATLSVAVSFVAACISFFSILGEPTEDQSHLSTAWTWLAAGDFDVGLSILVDPLSIFMMLIVSGVGALIVGYSIGYMDGEDEERRYFAYMALFVFSMLLLVQGGNLLLLLVGWGLVGLSSYLLIGFHHERPSAVAAAKKAFIMNAFGDATMALAFFLLIQRTGSLTFESSFDWAGGADGLVGRESRRARAARRAPSRSRRSFRSRPGSPTRWRARPRSAPSSTRRRWSPPASTCSSARRRSSKLRPHPGSCGRPRCGDDPARRADRARPGRHQARHRVLDDVADRLHVPRRGAGCVRELDVPPDDARVLQGAALPRRRDRHPRAHRRAGHAKDGRPAAVPAADVRRVPHRRARADRHPAALRILLEGLDPRLRARLPAGTDRPCSWSASSGRS